MPSSTLLPTPVPANRPMRWPRPTVSIALIARTPVSSGSRTGSRSIALMRRPWIGAGRVSPAAGPFVHRLAVASTTRPSRPSPTGRWSVRSSLRRQGWSGCPSRGRAPAAPAARPARPAPGRARSPVGIRVGRPPPKPTTSASTGGAACGLEQHRRRPAARRPAASSTRPVTRQPTVRPIGCASLGQWRCSRRGSAASALSGASTCAHALSPLIGSRAPRRVAAASGSSPPSAASLALQRVSMPHRLHADVRLRPAAAAMRVCRVASSVASSRAQQAAAGRHVGIGADRRLRRRRSAAAARCRLPGSPSGCAVTSSCRQAPAISFSDSASTGSMRSPARTISRQAMVAASSVVRSSSRSAVARLDLVEALRQGRRAGRPALLRRQDRPAARVPAPRHCAR